MQTRYADKDDLPEVYVMYLAGLEELGEEYDEQDCLDFMLLCWSKAPCILLIQEDEIVGFAGLNTYTPANNKKKTYLRDYMFYTKPSCRGIRSWRTLCKSVQEVADKFKLEFAGEHRLTGSIEHHERLIRMAGAVPKAIISIYRS